jgi:hypothetical protein
MNPNIHLVHKAHNTYEMILHPTTIPPVGSCEDIVIQWPVDPNFTGKAGIVSMLKATPQFKEATFL